jgi:hypothetical protein
MKPALAGRLCRPDWAFDARLARCVRGQALFARSMLFDEGDLRIFQLRGAAP